MNTADISQGSSGGALLNVYGQVIAVTSGAYTYGNSMYLAVPVDPVMSADLTSHSWTLKEVKQMGGRQGRLKEFQPGPINTKEGIRWCPLYHSLNV